MLSGIIIDEKHLTTKTDELEKKELSTRREAARCFVVLNIC